MIKERLESILPLKLAEQLEIFYALRSFFSSHPEATDPFPELNGQDLSSLQDYIEQLDRIKAGLDDDDCGLLDCFAAEEVVSNFLVKFSFLVQYNMASIKNIGYQEIRNYDPRYIHRYAALGLDSKAQRDAEKIEYTERTVNTHSVIIYKGKAYENYINLFPFIIDYNALIFEHGSRICFFRSLDVSTADIEYIILDDGSSIKIESCSTTESYDYNSIMLDQARRKQYNLDIVSQAFREACEQLLQED